MGFRVKGLEIRFQGFGVLGLGFSDQGLGLRVQDLGLRVKGQWFRVEGVKGWVQGSGFRGHRGSSLIRNSPLLGPYSRAMPRALRWSEGGAVSYE